MHTPCAACFIYSNIINWLLFLKNWRAKNIWPYILVGSLQTHNGFWCMPLFPTVKRVNSATCYSFLFWFNSIVIKENFGSDIEHYKNYKTCTPCPLFVSSSKTKKNYCALHFLWFLNQQRATIIVIRKKKGRCNFSIYLSTPLFAMLCPLQD